MQLVVSIFLGAVLGLFVGYTLWADESFERIELQLKNSGLKWDDDLYPIYIRAYAGALLREGHQSGAPLRVLALEDFGFVRRECARDGSILGGLAGAMLCVGRKVLNRTSTKSCAK